MMLYSTLANRTRSALFLALFSLCFLSSSFGASSKVNLPQKVADGQNRVTIGTERIGQVKHEMIYNGQWRGGWPDGAGELLVDADMNYFRCQGIFSHSLPLKEVFIAEPVCFSRSGKIIFAATGLKAFRLLYERGFVILGVDDDCAHGKGEYRASNGWILTSDASGPFRI